MLVYVDEYNLILFYILCAYKNQRRIVGAAGRAGTVILRLSMFGRRGDRKEDYRIILSHGITRAGRDGEAALGSQNIWQPD